MPKDFSGAPSLRILKGWDAFDLQFSSDIHSLVPLHPAFRCAMLNEEQY
jgi:hypothetical protein